jgi:hypothetical protein
MAAWRSLLGGAEHRPEVPPASPGAILFTLVWLVATWAFGVYVANFGFIQRHLRSLGGMVVLLLWFYPPRWSCLWGRTERDGRRPARPEAASDRRRKVSAVTGRNSRRTTRPISVAGPRAARFGACPPTPAVRPVGDPSPRGRNGHTRHGGAHATRQL